MPTPKHNNENPYARLRRSLDWLRAPGDLPDELSLREIAATQDAKIRRIWSAQELAYNNLIIDAFMNRIKA